MKNKKGKKTKTEKKLLDFLSKKYIIGNQKGEHKIVFSIYIVLSVAYYVFNIVSILISQEYLNIGVFFPISIILPCLLSSLDCFTIQCEAIKQFENKIGKEVKNKSNRLIDISMTLYAFISLSFLIAYIAKSHTLIIFFLFVILLLDTFLVITKSLTSIYNLILK